MDVKPTLIIPAETKHLVYLMLAYCTDTGRPFTIDALRRSDVLPTYGVSLDDAMVALREAIALEHAEVDAMGNHSITEEGLVYLQVQSAVLQSAADARKAAEEGDARPS